MCNFNFKTKQTQLEMQWGFNIKLIAYPRSWQAGEQNENSFYIFKWLKETQINKNILCLLDII